MIMAAPALLKALPRDSIFSGRSENYLVLSLAMCVTLEISFSYFGQSCACG